MENIPHDEILFACKLANSRYKNTILAEAIFISLINFLTTKVEIFIYKIYISRNSPSSNRSLEYLPISNTPQKKPPLNDNFSRDAKHLLELKIDPFSLSFYSKQSSYSSALVLNSTRTCKSFEIVAFVLFRFQIFTHIIVAIVFVSRLPCRAVAHGA